MKNIDKKNIQLNNSISSFQISHDLNKVQTILGVDPANPPKSKSKKAILKSKPFPIYRPLWKFQTHPDLNPYGRFTHSKTSAPNQLYFDFNLQKWKTTISVEDTNMDMILCPSGFARNAFMCPAYMSKPFWMSETEITLGFYFAVMQQISVPTEYKDYPFWFQIWEDVCEFCNKLSEIFGFEPVYSLQPIYSFRREKDYAQMRLYPDATDHRRWDMDSSKGDIYIDSEFKKLYVYTRKMDANGFRVPTEFEWEYAAYANTPNEIAGLTSGEIYKVGNFRKEGYDNRKQAFVMPVKQLKPNEWGFYDMMGNVSEICEDFRRSERDISGKEWEKVPRITNSQGWSSYIDPYFPPEFFETHRDEPNVPQIQRYQFRKVLKGGYYYNLGSKTERKTIEDYDFTGFYPTHHYDRDEYRPNLKRMLRYLVGHEDLSIPCEKGIRLVRNQD